MRVLFLSAFYPPHVVGGWEQLARDIKLQLQERGHKASVLTSRYTRPDVKRKGPDEADVARILELESDLYHYHPSDLLKAPGRLQHNLATTRRTIEVFEPDVVFVHVMFNLSRAVPWLAEQFLPGRVVYYIANDWPHEVDPHRAYWQGRATRWWLTAGKRLLSPLPLWLVGRREKRFKLGFEHVLCVSEAVRKDLAQNAGIATEAMRVVYNGVETDRFAPRAQQDEPGHSLTLLYAGNIVEHKGVHTAIEAMALLAGRDQLNGTQLRIVGSGHPTYEQQLREMVRNAHLEGHVQFVGRVPREEMPAILQQADVLLLPSLWEEPLSRMMQEAMASGLVVVGTLTGGSGELLVEGETGLTFPPRDAQALAQQLQRLQASADLRSRLAQNGRAAVVARFDFTRMVDEIEQYLVSVVAGEANNDLG